MIKINLLGGPKVVSTRVAAPSGLAPEAFVVSGALLVALGLASLFIWWSWTSKINKLKDQLQKELTEQRRLAGIRAQSDAYLLRLRLLETRIKTIHDLEASRVGPVELMRVLGVTADRTNDLYLLSVTAAGPRMVLRGQANSIDSIAGFLGTLNKTGTMSDVQLRQANQDDIGKRTSYKFNLDCQYKIGPPVPAAGGAPAAQPGATPPVPPRGAGM